MKRAQKLTLKKLVNIWDEVRSLGPIELDTLPNFKKGTKKRLYVDLYTDMFEEELKSNKNYEKTSKKG